MPFSAKCLHYAGGQSSWNRHKGEIFVAEISAVEESGWIAELSNVGTDPQ